MWQTVRFRSGRLRFSIRALLIVTALAGLSLAWVHRARQQQLAVELLRKSNPGAAVFYDTPCGAPGAVGPESDSFVSRWVRERFGIDYGATVLRVDMSYPTDADLECLSRFPRLQSVTLSRSIDLTDAGLSRLLPLAELRILTISDAEQLTDDGLRQLESLTSLEILRLDLGRRHVSREVLESLRRALPKCRIDVGGVNQEPIRLAHFAPVTGRRADSSRD